MNIQEHQDGAARGPRKTRRCQSANNRDAGGLIKACDLRIVSETGVVGKSPAATR
jgi:hypothetical protein